MARRKKLNNLCPDCNGRKTMLYKDEDGEYIDKCDLCHGSGIFIDQDIEEKFLGRYEFND